jgi:hypothetical protein
MNKINQNNYAPFWLMTAGMGYFNFPIGYSRKINPETCEGLKEIH